MSPSSSRLAKGTRLGDFEIQSLLGAGGMGEVYRARDLRLRRDVAIKILPASFAADPDRLRRFEQEAMAAAALNHPNILAIYQLGTYEGAPYIVAELLDGDTLREAILRGPMTPARITDYGAQIARGLAAAHEKGIVHRDLKPENLFVTKDQRIKILDFGLAKLTQSQREYEATAPTVASATDTGVVMGTVGYMAPEQVSGEPTDHRADIFALGAILYEMITGIRAFKKPTSAETMTAILREEPRSMAEAAPETPPAMQRLVLRCLEKNAGRRFQSASDLAFALEALSDSSVSRTLTTPDQSNVATKWRWTAAVIAFILVTTVVFVWLNAPLAPPRILATTQLTHDGLPKSDLETDGVRLYISEGATVQRIVQVSVNGGEPSLLPTPFANAILMGISHDHTRLLAFSREATETMLPLWSLPLPSGTPRHLVDLDNSGPFFILSSPDDQKLLFSRGSDIYIADADGSNPRVLASLPGLPGGGVFSPDGKLLRFNLRASEHDSLWEMNSDGTHSHSLSYTTLPSENACCGNWSPDGRYFFYVKQDSSGVNLWAIREQRGIFRWRRFEPVQLTSGPLAVDSWAISPDGKKLFVAASQGRAELVRYEPTSKQFVPFLSGISAGELDYSNDGKWVTYAAYPDQTIWRARADGSDRLQLTYSPTVAALPRWSPDGTQIVYVAADPGKTWSMFLISAQGGSPQPLLNDTTHQVDPVWSPDGKRIAFGRQGKKADGIYVIDLDTRQTSLIPGSEKLFSPRWSPDGRYLAALNQESTKLFLLDWKSQTWSEWLSEPGALGFPTWSRDSKYLYYDVAYTQHGTFRRVKVGENHSELVADLKDLQRYSIAPAFGWSGLAPDGSALFDRDLSTDEVYAMDLSLP